MRPGAVVYTEVAGIIVKSSEAARYLVKCVDEWSGHLSACHVQTNFKVAQLLMGHTRWVELQTDYTLKKIVSDGGKEYMKGPNKLQADEIKICPTFRYTL